MKRLNPAIQLAVTTALVVLAGCGRSEKNPHPGDPTPHTVQVASAIRQPLERSLVVVGSFAAREEAVVAAQVAGQIEQCRVDLGSVVTNGQELALIDTAAHEARQQQATANLDRAQAAAANALRDLDRVRQLQRERIASTAALDAAEATATQTAADIKSAEAALAVAKLDLERSRVKAPFPGSIASRLVSTGDYVGVGAPIARLVETDVLRLKLDVPERNAGQVSAGQTVRVLLESSTNVVTGTLSRVAPAIREADRMLAVEADIPNPGHLRAGSFARAEIVVNPDEPALCVPESALTSFAGLDKVVCLKDGKAEERTVKLGRRAGGWVEIVAGLSTDEAVVLKPAGLRTGQPLTLDAKAR